MHACMHGSCGVVPVFMQLHQTTPGPYILCCFFRFEAYNTRLPFPMPTDAVFVIVQLHQASVHSCALCSDQS